MRTRFQLVVLSGLLAALFGLLAVLYLHGPEEHDREHGDKSCAVCQFFTHSAVDTRPASWDEPDDEPRPRETRPAVRLEAVPTAVFSARAPPSVIR